MPTPKELEIPLENDARFDFELFTRQRNKKKQQAICVWVGDDEGWARGAILPQDLLPHAQALVAWLQQIVEASDE